MDPSQIIAAQQLSGNQFGFDQEAFERSILRIEARYARLRNIWSQCSAYLGCLKLADKIEFRWQVS